MFDIPEPLLGPLKETAKMLKKMDLTQAEMDFAWEQGHALMQKAFSTYERKQKKHNLRIVAMCASLAVALSLADKTTTSIAELDKKLTRKSKDE
jgi:hypothetical protein